MSFCHCLCPVPAVAKERTVALPEKSPVWDTEDGLGLTFCWDLFRSLSFSKDAGHSLSLPKVPNTTLRFDGSLEGLPESSKTIALTAIGYIAKGCRLMVINRLLFPDQRI